MVPDALQKLMLTLATWRAPLAEAIPAWLR